MPELEKPITVMLDRERCLRLTAKGMLEFQKVTGKSLLKGFKSDNIEDNLAMVWACLIHEDKELTYDKFLDLVDLGNMTSIMGAVGKYVESALSDSGRTDGNPLAGKSRRG